MAKNFLLNVPIDEDLSFASPSARMLITGLALLFPSLFSIKFNKDSAFTLSATRQTKLEVSDSECDVLWYAALNDEATFFLILLR